MTPEGKVKAKLKKLLEPHKLDGLYQHWPVLNGMGAPELDCNITYYGRPISIECKALGKKFTPRQKETTVGKHAAGALVLGFDGCDQDIEHVKNVLASVREQMMPFDWIALRSRCQTQLVDRGFI